MQSNQQGQDQMSSLDLQDEGIQKFFENISATNIGQPSRGPTSKTFLPSLPESDCDNMENKRLYYTVEYLYTRKIACIENAYIVKTNLKDGKRDSVQKNAKTPPVVKADITQKDEKIGNDDQTNYNICIQISHIRTPLGSV